jgi:hypothetical protein
MNAQAGPHNLTGIWHGLYTYPLGNVSVAFVATLIDAGNALSGSTHEPCVFGGDPSQTLFAMIDGRRHDRAITFLKIYDGANPAFGTVAYDGTLSPDGTEIEGHWMIPGTWSGTFLMIRPAGRSEAVTRRISESV